MDRQRIEGDPEKRSGGIKQETGKVIGGRHPEPEGKDESPERRVRSRAMDALREVVNQQK
jgi:uncharacterized protein YjbJ (UPF0337 family)